VCGNREWAAANAELTGQTFLLTSDYHGRRDSDPTDTSRNLDDPLTTITSKARHCVVAADIKEVTGHGKASPAGLKFFGSDVAQNTGDLGALKLIEFDPDKEGLPKAGRVFIQFGHKLYELDVKLRLLEPHELAQAQGFCKGISSPAIKQKW
jgi:hypothetical protein